MSKIDDFSNAGLIDGFRYSLIKLIAGDTMVVLNTRIDIIDRKEGYAARVCEVNGGLVEHSAFPGYSDKMIQLSQVKK